MSYTLKIDKSESNAQLKYLRRLRTCINFLITIVKKPLILVELQRIINDLINTINGYDTELKYFDFNKLELQNKEKLFILGSGVSINRQNDKHWNEIAQNISFGFNYFVSHEFTANAYFFESSEVHKEQKLYYTALVKDSHKLEKPLIFNQKHYNQNVLSPPDEIKKHIYFQNPFRLPSSNRQLISLVLRYGEYFLPFDNPNYGIHHSSSLCYLINLGVRLGFKNIILVGIDLKSNDYFFYERNDDISIQLTDIYKELLKGTYKHRTADPKITSSYHSLTTPDYIKLYNKYVCKRKGVSLQVANPDSLLAEFLPVYHFKDSL